MTQNIDMVGEENQTTDNERQTTSNVCASETHTTSLKPVDTTESVETPVAHDASVPQLVSGEQKTSDPLDETITHQETVSQGCQSNTSAQPLGMATEEISKMEDNSPSITLSSDKPTKEDTQEQKSSSEKVQDLSDDRILTSETRAKQSADDVPVSQSDDVVSSDDEPFQELPLTAHKSGAHWDSDATPLATLTVCTDKVGGTNDIANAKTHPVSSSAAKMSLTEEVAKHPAIRYPEEIELEELNNTVDERENLLTER